jgi:VanZ family protein
VQPALRWLAVVSWMGIIFSLSANPPLATPLEPFYDFSLKKLAHIAEYAILTALLFWALRLHVARRSQAVLIAALIAMLYAASDEWHQTFVPRREGSLRDVGIDVVGISSIAIWLRIKWTASVRTYRASRSSEYRRIGAG